MKNKPSAKDLAKEVLECDQERLRAQMSGLETGWEHPNTQTYFKRLVRMAEMILEADRPVKELRKAIR